MSVESSKYKERLTIILKLLEKIEKIEKSRQIEKYTEAIVAIEELLAISCDDVQKEYTDLKIKFQNLIQEEQDRARKEAERKASEEAERQARKETERKAREEERKKLENDEATKKAENEKLLQLIEQLKTQQEKGQYKEAIVTIDDLIAHPLTTEDMKKGYLTKKKEIEKLEPLQDQLNTQMTQENYPEALITVDSLLRLTILTKEKQKEYNNKKNEIQKLLKEKEKKQKEQQGKITNLEQKIHQYEQQNQYVEAIATINELLQLDYLPDEVRSDYTKRKDLLEIASHEMHQKEEMTKFIGLDNTRKNQLENEKFEEAIGTYDEILTLSVLNPEQKTEYANEREEVKQVPPLLKQVKQEQEQENYTETSSILGKLANIFHKIKIPKLHTEYEKKKTDTEKIPILLEQIKQAEANEDHGDALAAMDLLLQNPMLLKKTQSNYKKEKTKLQEVVKAQEEVVTGDEMRIELETLDFDPEKKLEAFDGTGKKLELKSSITKLPIKLGVMIPENDKFEAKLKNPKDQTAAFISILWNPRIPQRIYILPVTPVKGIWLLQCKLIKSNIAWEYEFNVIIETTTTLSVN